MNDSKEQILFGLPIDPDIIFSNHKHIHNRRVEKRQTKFIAKLSFLKSFLKEDEKILCVTTGHSPMSFFEQWIKGLWIFYIKRSLFVFTNKRVLHIPTKMNYSYRNSISQILYADCKSIVIKGHTLAAKYKNNIKEKFYYIDRKERKKIKYLLKTMSTEGQQSPTQTRTHLCPRCAEALIKDKYICPNCNLEFKNKVEARKISITYPGGGYFYTRHPIMGAFDALVELFLMATIITSLINIIMRYETGDISSTVAVVLILAMEKTLTVYDSNKFIDEYIPIEKEIEPIV